MHDPSLGTRSLNPRHPSLLPGLDLSYRKGYYSPREQLIFERRKTVLLYSEDFAVKTNTQREYTKTVESAKRANVAPGKYKLAINRTWRAKRVI